MLKKYMYHGQEILPPKSDIVFKAIFGAEGSRDLLAAFLRDMLRLDIPDGSCLTLMNTEVTPTYGYGKLIRMDVRIKLSDGRLVNVEIQISNQGDTIPRSLFYNDRLFVSQLEVSQPYQELRPAISLIIVDFIVFKEEINWYNTFRLKNVETGSELSDLKELTFVELPKWLKLRRSPKDVLEEGTQEDAKEKWALFLSTNEGEVLDMLAEKDEEMLQAIQQLLKVSSDPKLQYEYDMRLRALLDYISEMAHARETGLAQGMEQGLEQGMEQGLKQGLEQGGMRKAFVVARNLKQLGLSWEEISAATELSVHELRKQIED